MSARIIIITNARNVEFYFAVKMQNAVIHSIMDFVRID